MKSLFHIIRTEEKYQNRHFSDRLKTRTKIGKTISIELLRIIQICRATTETFFYYVICISEFFLKQIRPSVLSGKTVSVKIIPPSERVTKTQNFLSIEICNHILHTINAMISNIKQKNSLFFLVNTSDKSILSIYGAREET